MVELKGIKHYEIIITFSDAVPASAFAGLDGVARVEGLPDGHSLRLGMQGPADAVVKAAAKHHVLSLTSHEPSLEDIFLRYYQGDGQVTGEESHVVR